MRQDNGDFFNKSLCDVPREIKDAISEGKKVKLSQNTESVNIFNIPILATELKPAGCRSYAMTRPSGIQNEILRA